jgi:hypothetical protein
VVGRSNKLKAGLYLAFQLLCLCVPFAQFVLLFSKNKLVRNLAIIIISLWPFAFAAASGFGVVILLYGPIMGPAYAVVTALEGRYLGIGILLVGCVIGGLAGSLVQRFTKRSGLATFSAMIAFYSGMMVVGNQSTSFVFERKATKLPGAYRCIYLNSIDDMVWSGLDDQWSGAASFHAIAVTDTAIYNWSFKSFGWVSEGYDMSFFGMTKAEMIAKCAKEKGF